MCRGAGLQIVQALEFAKGDLRFLVRVAGDFEHMNTAAGERIECFLWAAMGQVVPGMVDTDVLAGLHALARGFDDAVGRVDDVLGGTVVFHQRVASRVVVGFELADVAHTGAVERIDVLVVIANHHQRDAVFFGLQRATGDGADQGVVVAVDVLIFIDEQEAQAGEQAVAQNRWSDSVCSGVGCVRSVFCATQASGGLADDLAEIHGVTPFDGDGIAGAGQPHGQAVQGLHRDARRIATDQRP
ncbi:hypothetical protein SDC9_162734 [bioreactor metagenome]|uniref:Uncharacterized protein n=1 Tax=bioreactor metagenome TaxID=1076179 RepID=A0A645FP88_9ZZZZ